MCYARMHTFVQKIRRFLLQIHHQNSNLVALEQQKCHACFTAKDWKRKRKKRKRERGRDSDQFWELNGIFKFACTCTLSRQMCLMCIVSHCIEYLLWTECNLFLTLLSRLLYFFIMLVDNPISHFFNFSQFFSWFQNWIMPHFWGFSLH